MDWKQYVSAMALVVSIGSCTVSYNLSRRTAITSIEPVLVFQYDLNGGWFLRNVGNGPALNVLIAMKESGRADWTQPMRIPPLSEGGQFSLQKWPTYGGARILGVSYFDILQRAYSTTCVNDLSLVHEGNILKAWPDDQIRRHWAPVSELRQSEEPHRRATTEPEPRAEEARQRDRERIAKLEQRQEDIRPSGAALNVPIANLFPRAVRGEIEVVNLPVEAGPLFLLLSIPDTRPFPSYKLEIVNRGTGRLVWKGEGLEASRLNEVSLILSRDALSSGDYQLRLYGLKGGNAELVEQYELRITHE